MVFGLTSRAYNDYRIRNVQKENYTAQPKHALKNLSYTARGIIFILEILLTIMAILALVDLAMIYRWNAWLLVTLLILYFIPVVGDVIALSAIIYWLVAIGPKGHSVLLERFSFKINMT